MDSIQKHITNAHQARFGKRARLYRSPGRINIIGEHTDYNEGFVLPAAINRYVYIGISKRSDRLIRLYSENFGEVFVTSVDQIESPAKLWVNYILGVFKLIMSGHNCCGFDMTIYGDVPIGSGLSSSAALESAVGYALNDVFDLGYNRMQLAKIGQQCEHEFIGVRCGIMDQFASLHGKSDSVMKLDCRSLEYSYFPMELGDYEFVLLNSKVSHSLASTAYNDRRRQCEIAVQYLQNIFPDVRSLRDASVEMLDDAIFDKEDESYKKARFVIEEIQRVYFACDYLNAGNLKKVGELLYVTHEGLRDAYQVSCSELDYLVDYVSRFPDVLGARMMGGGFGGCTLNLVKKNFTDNLLAKVVKDYEVSFGIELESYVVELGEGAVCLGPVFYR